MYTKRDSQLNPISLMLYESNIVSSWSCMLLSYSTGGSIDDKEYMLLKLEIEQCSESATSSGHLHYLWLIWCFEHLWAFCLWKNDITRLLARVDYHWWVLTTDLPLVVTFTGDVLTIIYSAFHFALSPVRVTKCGDWLNSTVLLVDYKVCQYRRP